MSELLIYGVLFLAVALIGWLLLGFDSEQDIEEEDEWDDEVRFTTSYPRKDR